MINRLPCLYRSKSLMDRRNINPVKIRFRFVPFILNELPSKDSSIVYDHAISTFFWPKPYTSISLPLPYFALTSYCYWHYKQGFSFTAPKLFVKNLIALKKSPSLSLSKEMLILQSRWRNLVKTLGYSTRSKKHWLLNVSPMSMGHALYASDLF